MSSSRTHTPFDMSCDVVLSFYDVVKSYDCLGWHVVRCRRSVLRCRQVVGEASLPHRTMSSGRRHDVVKSFHPPSRGLLRLYDIVTTFLRHRTTWQRSLPTTLRHRNDMPTTSYDMPAPPPHHVWRPPTTLRHRNDMSTTSYDMAE